MSRGRKKEPREEKDYSIVEEAEHILKQLVDRYPKELWTVNPTQINVLGVENAERPKSCKTLAKIRAVAPIYKALLAKHNITVKYLIELYWSDWREWNSYTKQWIVFHELLHIPGPDEKGLVKHDVQDFGLAVDIVGIDGYEASKSLPNLLEGEPVKFREDLLLRLHMNKDEMSNTDDADDANDTPTPPEE